MQLLSLVVSLALMGQPSGDKTEALSIEEVLLTLIAEVDVSAKVEGMLDEMVVREGAMVDAGGTLGRLDWREAVTERDRAEIELHIAEQQADNDITCRYARKSSEVAHAELRRALESVANYAKSISQTEVDRLRLAAERADLEIEQAERDLRIAQFTKALKASALVAATLKLESRRIVAPQPGMVVEIHRKPGEWVKAGEPLVRIVRLDRLRAEGFLTANIAGGDVVGRPVRLVATLPGGRQKSFQGVVVFASPELEPVSGQFRVWAEIENPDGLLRPGQPATMTLAPVAAPSADGKGAEEKHAASGKRASD